MNKQVFKELPSICEYGDGNAGSLEDSDTWTHREKDEDDEAKAKKCHPGHAQNLHTLRSTIFNPPPQKKEKEKNNYTDQLIALFREVTEDEVVGTCVGQTSRVWWHP